MDLLVNHSKLSDAELINLLKLGDEQAFYQLYKLYSQKLYSNLKRLVKSDEIAEELMQELFFKLWDKRSSINIETSFKSYLYKISENIVYDFFRKVNRDKKLRDKLIAAACEQYSSVEDLYIQQENQFLFNKAINQLPPKRKKIFILCKIDGKSYEEVSEMLSISQSTINDHIVKATKAIREIMFKPENLLTIYFTCNIFEEINSAFCLSSF